MRYILEVGLLVSGYQPELALSHGGSLAADGCHNACVICGKGIVRQNIGKEKCQK